MMFRIQTWHFILLFFVALIVVEIIGKATMVRHNEINNKAIVEELQPENLYAAVAEGINCVLFYRDSTYACNLMESRLGEVIEDEPFAGYKLDVGECPDGYVGNIVSGVPSIIIYKQGKEVSRIMGVVSSKNLEMIIKRVEDENRN